MTLSSQEVLFCFLFCVFSEEKNVLGTWEYFLVCGQFVGEASRALLVIQKLCSGKVRLPAWRDLKLYLREWVYTFDKNPYVRTAAVDKGLLREMFPPVHVSLFSVRSFRVKINNLELNLRNLALYQVLFSLLKLRNLPVKHWTHQIKNEFCCTSLLFEKSHIKPLPFSVCPV